MAELLLRHRLEERGVAARVTSAGFLSAGWPATDDAIAVMAEVGLDLSSHRSRTVTPTLVEQADLVIAMTRQHVVDLVLLAPDHWARVFQVRDLGRRATGVGRRSPQQPWAAWLDAIGGHRRRADLVGAHLEDDIPDPVGGPRAAYLRTRGLLDELLSSLARLMG
jgi:protein-tyrosine phosphatase